MTKIGLGPPSGAARAGGFESWALTQTIGLSL